MEERYIKAVDTYNWVRPAGWLTMPTITSSDNKLAFLFAVYENQENCFTISYPSATIVATADWGDGTTTTINSTAIREKRYTYSAISSIVLQDANGVNYKQVIITISYTSGTLTTWYICPYSTLVGSGYRPGPNQILETIISWDNLVILGTPISPAFCRPPSLMQNLIIKKMVLTTNGTGGSSGGYFSYLTGLRNIEGISNINTTLGGGASNTFINLGSINKIDFIWNGGTGAGGFSGLFSNSTFRELGTLTFLGTGGTLATCFLNCYLLEKVGTINMGTMTLATSMFNGCNKLRSIGTITSTSNTSITSMFINCFVLESIVFSAGSCASVTLASAPFTNCWNLKTLKMPGMAISFSIANCSLQKQAIIDLLNDLATVGTTQNIVLTGNPGLDDLTALEIITILTPKNWTYNA